jgi:hypothetical protein
VYCFKPVSLGGCRDEGGERPLENSQVCAILRGKADHILKFSTLPLGLLLICACATSPGSYSSDPGIYVFNQNTVLYEGPELVAVVAYRQGKHSVAEEWLTLAVELTSPRGSGPTVVRRSDISVYTPEGRRLALASQDDFVGNFVRLRIPIDRTLAFLPLLYRVEPNRIPSDRWFFAIAAEKVGFDEIPINSSETFLGPLIFSVPGGVQPGRWRLVFELEESRPDIPFTIEVKK